MKGYRVKAAKQLKGALEVPGDKSISHRSIIFGSIANGRTEVTNLLEGEDVLHTVDCFRQMGVKIRRQGKKWILEGAGLKGLKEPKKILDCGNSGTSMRLLMGLLSGSEIRATLTGDISLNRRPMDRVIKPLASLGARVREYTEGQAFFDSTMRMIEVHGTELKGARLRIPIASAQVKSALLLAGLMSGQRVSVTEPSRSRDHTERMMKAFGARIKVQGHRVSLDPVKRLKGQKVIVPGDFSSACFFIVLGLIHPSPKTVIRIKNVGLNETRTGALQVLKKMGGKIRILKRRTVCGEPVGDLEVRPSKLRGTTISGKLIPWLIDEIPILCVAAAFAKGKTVIRDAEELRVKETDRIHAMAEQLPKFGVRLKERRDGLEIFGGEPLQGAEATSYGDHRIAMSLAVLGTVLPDKTSISDVDCVKTSFPNFDSLMRCVGANISITQEKIL